MKPLSLDRVLLWVGVAALSVAVFGPLFMPSGEPAFRKACGHGSGKVVDEAVCAFRMEKGKKPKKEAGQTDAQIVAARWAMADDDYYADMDRGATKDPVALAKDLAPYVPGITPADARKAAVIGRNNWVVWTAGNDRFWDQLASQSFGNVDLLKTISSAPGTKFGRHNRWRYLGLVNEPCFRRPTVPRQDRFGLYLDERDPACGPDPYENEAKYPGVKLGARGKTVPVGSLYGYGTGVVGLRLFPNPDFDEKAKARWDWYRYYNDPTYYNDKRLVRPYRVGMSCGFCHVGPDPTNPPKDPENPTWANLNSNPGAQYFWIDRIFGFDQDYGNYIFQLYHTSRPGALDTSLVSSDFINNPRTMNAIYALGPRVDMARHWGKETIKGAEQDNRQLNEYVPKTSPLNALYVAPDKVWTPRVLKDGSDSVGVMGSLNRVYINIGLFGDEWTTHFTPVIGGSGISPIRIDVGRKNSAYWVANESQTPNVALFFLATAKPDNLAAAKADIAVKDLPDNDKDGAFFLNKDRALIPRGKEVFAENCAACHSSKLPQEAYGYFPDQGCANANYKTCWNNYWRYAKSDRFKSEMRKIVAQPDFLDHNFLSTDQRVPADLLETNVCSAIATNAIRDNIWDNFSSESYKSLPSAGRHTVHDPYTGKLSQTLDLPAGGRGYTRPASLVSLWSTAPYLQNNTVGEKAFRDIAEKKYQWRPSTAARVEMFDASMREMLWPETRTGNVMFQTASGKLAPGQVDVTTKVSYIRIANGYLPKFVANILGWFAGTHFITDKGLQIGPIPAGTPVNLLSNLDLDRAPTFWGRVKHAFTLAKTVIRLTWTLSQIKDDTPPAQATETFRKAAPALIAASKCPDYIVNRGHYFGTAYQPAAPGVPSQGLPDQDKYALIAFLRTM